jgi:hypothetical protein
VALLADPVVVAVAPPGEPCAVVVVDPFAVVVVVEVVVLAVGAGGGAFSFSVDLHPVNIEQVIMLPIAYDISSNLFVFIRLVLSLDLAVTPCACAGPSWPPIVQLASSFAPWDIGAMGVRSLIQFDRHPDDIAMKLKGLRVTPPIVIIGKKPGSV